MLLLNIHCEHNLTNSIGWPMIDPLLGSDVCRFCVDGALLSTGINKYARLALHERAQSIR